MNKFNWEFLNNNSYETICNWWADWDWGVAPTAEMLPRVGIIVYNNTTPVYAGFLYETGTTIGWLEYVVSNKNASVAERRGGLGYLIETVGTIAKTKGIKTLFTSTLNKAFVQSLKKEGFSIGDEGMTQLIKHT